MANTPFITALTQAGLAKETTWGTPVAPTTADQFFPVMNPKLEDVIESVYDQNYRGRVSKNQGYQQGFRQSKYSFESQWYPDVCGNWLMGIMGADGWASSTTHPFTVLNTGMPPSYTVQDFYGLTGTHSRSLAGMYFDTVTMSATNKGPMKATVSLSGGKASALVARPTATYTTALPFLSWQGALTLNSVLKANLTSWDITFKRNVAAVLAMGAQDPSAAYSSEFEVSGKLTFQANDDVEYLLYSTTGQAAFPASMVFTSGSNTLTMVITSCQFETPSTLDRSTPILETHVSFLGIDNATDGGACKVTLVGGKSGAAY